MNQIKVTESSLRSKNIVYIAEAVSVPVSALDGVREFRSGKNRYELSVAVPVGYESLIKTEIEDKIADVISINYKYSFFKKRLDFSGLSNVEKELLLIALISADIDDDKKYIVKKLKAFNEYAIDGIFNFRMKPLKEKWLDVVGCIPAGFQTGGLKDFVSYLIRDKIGKKVYFEGGSLYDKRFNLLKRRELLAGDSGEVPIVKETLLASAGEVEIASPLPPVDEGYLKEFYGDRLKLSKGYFS